MTLDQLPDEAFRTSRRTVVKGAAWSLPVFAATTTVPLAAATEEPPEPCAPPELPTTTNWTVSGENCQDGGNGYPSYTLAHLLGDEYFDGTTNFVRLYADALSNITGDAYAWGTASLGTLTPGAIYLFTAKVRAQYATHSNDGATPDENHQNSFRTDVQGWIRNVDNDDKVAVTPRYSTRPDADGAPAGLVQIDHLNDNVSKRRMKLADNVPWNDFPTFSFEVPLDWAGESEFYWEFTVANRNARIYKERPATGGERWWNDSSNDWTKTANDDIDVTYPVFVNTFCPEP